MKKNNYYLFTVLLFAWISSGIADSVTSVAKNLKSKDSTDIATSILSSTIKTEEKSLLGFPVKGDESNLKEFSLKVEKINTKKMLVRYQGKAAVGERFPHFTFFFPSEEDWRPYTSIQCRFKITSTTPNLEAKRLSFVFNDNQGRRIETLEGNQTIAHAMGQVFPLNQWIEYSIPIKTIDRKEVKTFSVYVYSNPPGTDHQCEIEFEKLSLSGPSPSCPVFDGTPINSKNPVKRTDLNLEKGSKSYTINPKNGVKLVFDANGSLDSNSPLSGLMIRDRFNNATELNQVSGSFTSSNGILKQNATIASMGLKVECTYKTINDRIDVTGKVEDTTGKERDLSLYFGIPVSDGDWVWAKSAIQNTRPIQAMKTVPNYEEFNDRYPVATITNGTIESLTMAIRMDEPSHFRHGFNPQFKLFFTAFDMALLPEKRVSGDSLSIAKFSFSIYKNNPEWSFRSALDKYYKYYPEFFVRRVKKEGGWHCLQAPTKEQVEAGLTLHWHPDSLETARKSQEMGLLQLWYLEPEFFQLTLGDKEASSVKEGMERLLKWKDNDESEYQKTKDLNYYSYHGDRKAHQKYGEAVLKSVIYNEYGNSDVELVPAPWIGDSNRAAVFMCNLNPNIPNGLGSLVTSIFKSMADESEKSGVPAAGYALDSFLGFRHECRWDYRRELFSFSALQPVFNRGKLAQYAPLQSAEWLKDFSEKAHQEKRIVMLNNIEPSVGVMFCAPHSDVIGVESPTVADPDFYRAIMGAKTLTILTYEKLSETNLMYTLLHGFFPGGDNNYDKVKEYAQKRRELCAQGWEPITYARANDPAIRLERFGNSLVLFNSASTAREVLVTVDTKALPSANAEYKIDLEALETKILDLKQ